MKKPEPKKKRRAPSNWRKDPRHRAQIEVLARYNIPWNSIEAMAHKYFWTWRGDWKTAEDAFNDDPPGLSGSPAWQHMRDYTFDPANRLLFDEIYQAEMQLYDHYSKGGTA